MKGKRMNYDSTELTTCYNFLTNKDGILAKKVMLNEMNNRGWSIRFVKQALSEGSGEDIELTPRLTEHGVGYYDIDMA